MNVAVVVVAAGSGERLGAKVPKALVELAGRPMLDWSVQTFRKHPDVSTIVVVVPSGEVSALSEQFGGSAVVVVGGSTRQKSVSRGLKALPADAELVLVHDAARPLVQLETISAVVTALRSGAEAVIPVLPVADTVKRVNGSGQVVATVERADLRIVQTPQGFRRSVLINAHRNAADLGVADASDDAGLVEASGRIVTTVPGSDEAFKITTPYDLALANRLVGQ